MRIGFAVWFLAHGVAHLPGFLVSWQLRDFSGLPFHTTVLGDSVDIGTVGIRLIGVGWLLAAVAFAVLAAATILRVEWWHEGGLRRPGLFADALSWASRVRGSASPLISR